MTDSNPPSPTIDYNPTPMMIEYPHCICTPILLEQIAPRAIELAMRTARLQEQAAQAAAHAAMIAQCPRAFNTTIAIAISTFAPHPPVASMAERHQPQERGGSEEGEIRIIEIGDIPGNSPKPIPIPP
jgi:hypothetical protein